MDFNPRSRVGSDDIQTVEPDSFKDFNPRSRVGSDDSPDFTASILLHFNPRSRVGSDYLTVPREWLGQISIHAPV